MRTAYVLSICLLGFSVAAAEKEATLKVGAKSYAVSELPPPPEGFVSPMTWGVDIHIIERFGQAGVPERK